MSAYRIDLDLLNDRFHKLVTVRLLHGLPKVHHVSTHFGPESHWVSHSILEVEVGCVLTVLVRLPKIFARDSLERCMVPVLLEEKTLLFNRILHGLSHCARLPSRTDTCKAIRDLRLNLRRVVRLLREIVGCRVQEWLVSLIVWRLSWRLIDWRMDWWCWIARWLPQRRWGQTC